MRCSPQRRGERREDKEDVTTEARRHRGAVDNLVHYEDTKGMREGGIGKSGDILNEVKDLWNRKRHRWQVLHLVREIIIIPRVHLVFSW